MEEMAREEFFRLKKILEIKRRMYKTTCSHESPVPGCKSCTTKFVEKPEEECPVCGAIVTDYPTFKDEEITLDKKASKTDKSMLELFRRNISDIIEITADIKEKGVVAESVDHFLKTASELRDKLGKKKSIDHEAAAAEPSGPAGEVGKQLEPISSAVSVHKLCDECIRRFEEEQAKKGAKLDVIKENQEESTSEAAKLAMKKAQDTYVDLELGVFETEYKEVTKIIRVKKEDGTISEEKRVIKTKKETKAPVQPPRPNRNNEGQDGASMYQPSAMSSKSNPYGSNSKAVVMVTVKDRPFLKTNKEFVRKTKSESLMYVSSMICPIERYCISSASMLSYSDYVEFCSMTVVGSKEQENVSDFTLKELFASSSQFQEIFSYGGHVKSTQPSDTATNLSKNPN